MQTENRSSNTETTRELLPCPFCGQRDFLIERLDSDASVVICQGLTGPHEVCLARGPVGVAQDEGGRDKAVELWNARAEQRQGELESYPPCDYCGITPDYHPWHGSGLLTGVENRHIHACDGCRGKFPAHPGQGEGESLTAKPALTLQMPDPYDEREGPWFDTAEIRELGKLPAGTKLFLHPPVAGTGEVERLRAIERSYDLREELLTQVKGERDRMIARTMELAAQLAERDALLRAALQGCLDIELMRTMRGSIYTSRLSDRIKAALERKPS